VGHLPPEEQHDADRRADAHSTLTGTVRLGFLALAAAIAFGGFCALGWWQLERRAWKHTLVARIEQRVHAEPVRPPVRADWPGVSAARDEYRRVTLSGTFIHDAETLVQATTALGSGYWVLTPLRQADGTIVVVNRGFVPPQLRDRAMRSDGNPAGPVTVVGLLRISEAGGGFLRDNDPAADRWFSRDIAAIATARRLVNVAPFFVDAERRADASRMAPVGGLTVLVFSDNHLGYALTWFVLATMVVTAAVIVVRHECAAWR
jgi:surfeit locus 1 family protein